MEKDVDYDGYDVGSGVQMNDRWACRGHCSHQTGAEYFSYSSGKTCYCKSSTAGFRHGSYHGLHYAYGQWSGNVHCTGGEQGKTDTTRLIAWLIPELKSFRKVSHLMRHHTGL